MTEKHPDAFEITDPHRVAPVFVNDLVGRGVVNGVVNLTFATAYFTPNSDAKVDPDIVITSRLRMDLYCARQLYAALGAILAPANATTSVN